LIGCRRSTRPITAGVNYNPTYAQAASLTLLQTRVGYSLADNEADVLGEFARFDDVAQERSSRSKQLHALDAIDIGVRRVVPQR